MILPLGGSLNTVDAAERMPQEDVVMVENFVVSGAGRLRSRNPLKEQSLTTDLTVAIFPFPQGLHSPSGRKVAGVRVDWDKTNKQLKLYTVAEDAAAYEYVGVIAGSAGVVAERPDLTADALGGRLWIMDGTNQAPVAYYDPFATDKTYCPEFTFLKAANTAGDATTKKPMHVRTGKVYNNHLFVSGFGTEKDRNRPEVVRFSFMGMDATKRPTDKGDGGYYYKDTSTSPATVTGDVRNSGIFSISDYFMVGDRGTPIMAMGLAAGRLVMASTRAAYTVWGYDWNSWKVELIDNQRGCLTPRAMVEADGVLYWWSPLGPCRWGGGGRPEDIGFKIRERVLDASTKRMFAVHIPELGEVRWYYAPRTGPDSYVTIDNGDGTTSRQDADPSRALCYNYRLDIWTEHALGGNCRLTCIGQLPKGANFASPDTIMPPPSDTTPTEPTDPLLLIVPPEDLNKTSLSLSWTNKDTSDGTETEISYSTMQGLTGGVYTAGGSSGTEAVTVRGDGTLFLTEVAVGDWIIAGNKNNYRKVTSIISNTELQVGEANMVAIAFDAVQPLYKQTAGWSYQARVGTGVSTYSPKGGTLSYLWGVRHMRSGSYSAFAVSGS